ncbi:MAG: DcaP family trimeric outer membrane transporter [Methylococcaceae bacterium]|nr:DcaP family trimeric outer membrane transporter [Methylococcaceae bacterium]
MNLPAIVFIALFLLSQPSFGADEELRALVKELSTQVKQLSTRLNEVESELAQERQAKHQASPSASDGKTPAMADPKTATAPMIAPGTVAETAKAKPVTVGDIKGSFKIPGTDTSLAIGGFVKLDTIYNSVSAGKDNFGDQFLSSSTIPVSARHGEHSQINFHAKESRFWLKSFTPSAYGDINTYLELDLYGAADAYTPRLRHAYGSIGNFLAGQTWTTFLNVQAIPELNDIGGPVGINLLRQPMVRWNQPFSFAATPMEFQAALEAPKSRLAREKTSVLEAPDDDRYPDLIARINANPEWGNLSLTAMGRQIRYAPAVGSARSSWGGAVSLAGKIKTVGLDNLRFGFHYGDVLGRYININAFGDATLDTAGRRLERVDTYGAMAAYQHWWSDSWRSTLAYGFAQSDLPAYANGGLTRQAQSVHVNLLWSPLVQTTIGLEYLYATRSLENHLSGDLHRVQFSSRFNF